MKASPTIPRLTSAAALLVALAASACGGDFVPFNRLVSPRVLAIAAEPSMPGPGETSTLRALVYVPGEDPGVDLPGVTYSWSWCPMVPQGTACEVTPAQIAMFAQAGITLPPLDLGQGPTATFTHTIPPAALNQLCVSPPEVLKRDCEEGFAVQIRMIATFAARPATATTAAMPADEITSVSTMRLRFADKHKPNVSPIVESLYALKITKPPGGTELRETFPVGVEPAATLPRDTETTVGIVTPWSSIETYHGLDDNLKPYDNMREGLLFTWFIDSGDTDEERTSFNPNNNPLNPTDPAAETARFMKNLTNEWTPALSKDFPANKARLIVIARDNRGGVAWRDGFVNLEATP